MSYFAPYIDGTGLHMPTYEDRLSDLVTAYRSIFGIDSELSESVPDYQLLSMFAKALKGNGDMRDLRKTFRHLPMIPGGMPTEVSDDD